MDLRLSSSMPGYVCQLQTTAHLQTRLSTAWFSRNIRNTQRSMHSTVAAAAYQAHVPFPCLPVVVEEHPSRLHRRDDPPLGLSLPQISWRLHVNANTLNQKYSWRSFFKSRVQMSCWRARLKFLCIFSDSSSNPTAA